MQKLKAIAIILGLILMACIPLFGAFMCLAVTTGFLVDGCGWSFRKALAVGAVVGLLNNYFIMFVLMKGM